MDRTVVVETEIYKINMYGKEISMQEKKEKHEKMFPRLIIWYGNNLSMLDMPAKLRNSRCQPLETIGHVSFPSKLFLWHSFPS